MNIVIRFKNKLMLIFYNNYLKYNNLHICIYAFLIIWLFEWVYIIQYSLNFWSYTRIIFPYRIPASLIICFIYWLYVWGVSVWRRTLYGRFTRGDRKLWFKGFTSFWFTELSTILGIFLAACWMSWGPLPLMPRYFLMQKKSFLFELTLFTYIIWLIYLMRLGLKWYLWKTQATITCIIIFIISCLLWRDFITLYTRDVININIGSKWRYVKLNSIIYSLSNNWWTYHFIGNNTITHSVFVPLQNIIDSNFSINPFEKINTFTEYQKYHWLPIILKKNFDTNAFPIFNNINSLNHILINSFYDNNIEYILNTFSLDSNIFYPRKIGFYPKKIAMWYFLVVLKIWHHIMLFIWWFFYLMRLNTKKKSSYTLLSACYFNVYCCFLICILVYCFNLLPIWENFFRIKPYIRSNLQNWSIFNAGLLYCFDIFTLESSTLGSKRLLNKSFYLITDSFVTNFHNIFSKNNDWLIDEKILYYFGICR